MRKVVGVGAENSESKLFSDLLPIYAVFGNPAADGHQNFYVRSVPTRTSARQRALSVALMTDVPAC